MEKQGDWSVMPATNSNKECVLDTMPDTGNIAANKMDSADELTKLQGGNDKVTFYFVILKFDGPCSAHHC